MMIFEGDKLEVREPGSWNISNMIVNTVNEDGTFTVQLEGARYTTTIDYSAVIRNLSDPE